MQARDSSAPEHGEGPERFGGRAPSGKVWRSFTGSTGPSDLPGFGGRGGGAAAVARRPARHGPGAEPGEPGSCGIDRGQWIGRLTASINYGVLFP